MLITFSCSAYADITMFGDVASQLLKHMGHSGDVPSALMAKDVKQALKQLQDAVDADSQLAQSQPNTADDEGDEAKVSLSHRALPLIKLLKAADKAECNVMWDQK